MSKASNIVFIIEGEEDEVVEEEEQEYFTCCVCGVCKYHEEINFTDEKTYCFDCAPSDDE